MKKGRYYGEQLNGSILFDGLLLGVAYQLVDYTANSVKAILSIASVL